MEKFSKWRKFEDLRNKTGKRFSEQRLQMGIVLETASDYEMIEETIEIELDVKEERV